MGALRVVHPRAEAAPLSDAALVASVRAGEPWARESLFRRHAPMVIGFAYRLLGRDDEADDLAQDVFFQAWKSLGSLSEPEAFERWLKAIVVRTAHKQLRRRGIARRIGLVHSADIDPDSIVCDDAPPEVRIELLAIYEILNGLSARHRIALVLRRVEGASYEEIASQMETSISTAKRDVNAAELELGNALRRRR